MPLYYDDNYGFYEQDGYSDDETQAFYKQTQRESVWKKCKGCNRKVKIKRDYAYCNTCATKIEQGFDIG